MIRLVPKHYCDYCQKCLSDISPDEYLSHAHIVKGKAVTYEYCSMGCMINHYLKLTRKRSKK